MTDEEPRRTRAERVVHDVLDATLEELARVGFAALSVEEVARRASVNKTTVYRRWPDKSTLVQAAFETFQESVPPVDTGSLRDDLRAYIRSKLKLARTARVKALMHALQAEALNPALLDISRKLRTQEVAHYSRIFGNARARGELLPSVDEDVAMTVIEGAFTYTYLAKGKLVTDRQATQIIDLVLSGLLAPSRL